MGKVRGDLFGGYSGKIGKQYGRYVHGVNLNAIMPTKRGNKNATEQMLDNQERFKTLAQLATALLKPAQIGFKTLAKSYGPLVSEFDAFIKFNKAAVAVVDGMAEIDFGSLACSKGQLPQVGPSTASFAEPLEVTVPFTANTVDGADAADIVYAVLLQPDDNKAIMAQTTRSAETITVNVPSTWTGMTVHVYMFAVGNGRSNKGVISDCNYVGTGVIG